MKVLLTTILVFVACALNAQISQLQYSRDTAAYNKLIRSLQVNDSLQTAAILTMQKNYKPTLADTAWFILKPGNLATPDTLLFKSADLITLLEAMVKKQKEQDALITNIFNWITAGAALKKQ